MRLSLKTAIIPRLEVNLSSHLPQPTHLGTQPKTSTGTDRVPTLHSP